MDKQQNEQENNEIRMLKKEIENLRNIIKQKDDEINQKEENLTYLFELKEEKEKQLINIYHTKGWRLLEKLRTSKIKIQKLFSNPKDVLNKNEKYKISNNEFENNEVEESNVSIEENPLVSVVIPIYDRTDVLIKSIESIIDQTYENIELILVCDGSPKETLDIVKSYENHPKVRAFYFNNNSGNAVRGRNKAIKEAKGLYLAFHDSDDVAEKDRIKISLEYMKKYNSDVIYGGWRALVDGSREIDIKDGQEVFSPDCDYNMLKKICVPCQSTVMAKLEVLRKVGGLKTKMRYREDHELWLRLAFNGYKFKSVDKVLTNLRLHNGNLELSFVDQDDTWYKLMLEEHKKIEAMKPKIAYVIPGCGISGGIAVICQHANRLLKRGYDVILITEDDKRSIDWFPNQKVQVIPLSETPDNLDIVVATGWSTAYTIQNIKGKRKFYFVQSDESRFYPKDSREYKLAMDTYNFNYEFMTEAKWIKRWLEEKFDKDAAYVPNGLDENIIHKVSPMKPKGNKLRVLLEGPIDIPFKGMEDAFNAVKDIDCEVWCISSAGKPKPEWKCDVFFEKVPMIEMKNIYSSCDIFIKMSRVEGFFGPPLEMMACGGACVVGEVTGYDEYIKNEYNALVVEQRDVQGAAKALKRLIEDKNLRDKIIKNGKKTAEEWRWEPTIDVLEELFHKR